MKNSLCSLAESYKITRDIIFERIETLTTNIEAIEENIIILKAEHGAVKSYNAEQANEILFNIIQQRGDLKQMKSSRFRLKPLLGQLDIEADLIENYYDRSHFNSPLHTMNTEHHAHSKGYIETYVMNSLGKEGEDEN